MPRARAQRAACAAAAAAFVGLALAGAALADDAVELDRPPPAHYVNLRVGAAGDELGTRDELCLEVAPIGWLSVEGCGNGSGFLHEEPIPELAHFRLKLRVGSWSTRPGWPMIEPQVGVGFAELQLGEDSPGFDFGGTDPTRTSTAGPEVGLSLRSLVPLGNDFEGVFSVGAYLAWLPHADELLRPVDTLQPSFAVSLGVGF